MLFFVIYSLSLKNEKLSFKIFLNGFFRFHISCQIYNWFLIDSNHVHSPWYHLDTKKCEISLIFNRTMRLSIYFFFISEIHNVVSFHGECGGLIIPIVIDMIVVNIVSQLDPKICSGIRKSFPISLAFIILEMNYLAFCRIMIVLMNILFNLNFILILSIITFSFYLSQVNYWSSRFINTSLDKYNFI